MHINLTAPSRVPPAIDSPLVHATSQNPVDPAVPEFHCDIPPRETLGASPPDAFPAVADGSYPDALQSGGLPLPRNLALTDPQRELFACLNDALYGDAARDGWVHRRLRHRFSDAILSDARDTTWAKAAALILVGTAEQMARGARRRWLLTTARRDALTTARAARHRLRASMPNDLPDDRPPYGVAVRDAVQPLPWLERDVVEVIFYGGCTYREAAAALGTYEATVRRRLDGALGKLGVLLAENAGATSACRAVYRVPADRR